MEDSNNTPKRALEAMSIEKSERHDNCATHGAFTSEGYSIMNRPMHWSGCPSCTNETRAAEVESRRIRDAEAAQRRIEVDLQQSGIPIRFRGKDFSSYEVNTDAKERVRAIAMSFATKFQEHYDKGTTMVFSGRIGTGKSHLAMAIAQAIMPNWTAFYTSAIDAVRMVRDTWHKNSEKTETQVLNTLSRVHLLILDEVGVQYGTDAEQITLFDIIDKRYRDMMPTILLTNQDKEGMKSFLGDRSFDRLREGGIWVPFDWDSGRGSALPHDPVDQRSDRRKSAKK